MTIQEVHIDTPFSLSGFAAMGEDTILTEEVAYHPNLRRTRITALMISVILDFTLACFAKPITMGLRTMQR
jgi:hypothetical protein